MPNINLTPHKLALCCAALDNAISDLNEGIATAKRLGNENLAGGPKIVADMTALRQELYIVGLGSE